MTQLRSDFLRVLQERGYIHQCSDLEARDAKAAEGIVTAYVGYDATADSLHVGSLVSMMMLRWMQQTGHRPIVLMGGGTTKVGDPSGKDESRQLLSPEQIDANIANIKTIFENFLTFDSVKLRLEREQPLTFLEFNYMILQAYDFLELNKRHDCALQMGGSDQWGNIINGMELTRRIEGKEAFALTTPLITTASGAKMGKTAQGAVWLNEARLSHYDYWQFWRNTEDGDVGRFLKLFTELPLDEIARLEALDGAEINDAKKILADEATKLCRGEGAAAEAAETARQTFEEGAASEGLPVIEVPAADLADGIAAFDAFRRAGLAGSGGEARRLIKGGGARINDQKIADELQPLTQSDLDADGVIKLSAGKKRHALIRAV